MNNKICLTIAELEDFFKVSGVISLDTETTSLIQTELELEGISMCNGVDSIYIPFMFRKNGVKYWENVQSKETITFLNGKIKSLNMLILHNAPFDLRVLHKYGINPTCELFDTMVAQHLIDENSEKGLKKIATSILGVDTTNYEDACVDTGSKKFIEYACNDASWTYEIAMIQKEMLKDNGTMDLFRNIEMPFQYVLTEMAVTGIEVDLEKANKIKTQLVKDKEDAIIQMLTELNEPYTFQLDLYGNSNIISSINFSSPSQLSQILFNKLGLECIEQTPSGKPSVGKETLAKYKEHSFIKLLHKYKIIDKLLSGFFNPMPKFVESDGRVRPNFKDCGTRTGRMSCTKPNLQQLPKPNKAFPVETRACFVVPKGYKMITCDYSGQELRVLAEQTQEPGLIDVFNKGKDMHLSTANDFFNLGIPEEELYDTHPKCEENKEKYYNERFNAKTINFGIAYGKGAYGFSKDLNCSEEEAQKILDKYFGALPRVKQSIDECHSDVAKQGFVTTMFGRLRHFQALEQNGRKFYPKAAYRQSFNFLIQGYSADMIRKAMVDVHNMKKDYPKWDLKTIATIHDEAVWQVKEEYVDVASKKIKETFENAVKLVVPVVSDIGIGMNYSQAK